MNLTGTKRVVSVGLVALVGLQGCVQVAGPPERRVRDLPTSVEPGTPISTVLLSAAPFVEDQDNNSYPDTISASVFLFPDPRASPLPVHADGTITFTLARSSSDNEPIARWAFSSSELIPHAARVDVGAVYVFQLNMNTVASDRVPRQGASLSAQFEPTGDGSPVTSSPITVIVGAGTR